MYSDGARQNALANVLVPGDIVYFAVGDRIPADIRLVRSIDLEIDESNLTGETKPARKTTDKLEGFGQGHDPGISERTNTAFMGTLVRNGHGAGVVVATGQQSEFGVIFSMMQEIGDRKTPLQLSMDELAKKLSAISFVVIGIICLIGVYQQRSWLEMFTIGGEYRVPHPLTYRQADGRCSALSLACRRCYPGRVTDCRNCDIGSRRSTNGEKKGYC